MGKIEYIFNSRDLTTLSEQILGKVDDAVMAAACRIRDNMKQAFKSGSSLYKYGTNKYYALAEGLRVNRLNDGKVRIHALGGVDDYHTYKTRFFVGGSIPRTQTKWQGRSIKPFTKGYIQANDAVDKGFSIAENTLNTYISHVLEN